MSCEEVAGSILAKLYDYVKLERDYLNGLIKVGEYVEKRDSLRNELTADLKKSVEACKPREK